MSIEQLDNFRDTSLACYLAIFVAIPEEKKKKNNNEKL